MRTMAALLISLPLMSACVEESSPQQAEQAAEAVAGADTAAAIEAERKSIEQAADAAAKLVEAEAQEEIDAINDAEAEVDAEVLGGGSVRQ